MSTQRVRAHGPVRSTSTRGRVAPTPRVHTDSRPAAPLPETGATVTTAHPLTRHGHDDRDRYIDSLRALALVRVVAYHLFGWIWLPILFPSMGIMFALGGSLAAASLDREHRHYVHLLLRRLRRLLPPLWAMGLVFVPLMLWAGWTVTATEGVPLTWSNALAWVVPYVTPPASAAAADAVVPLWYISTYMWLMLLTPATLWLFRHWPIRMMVFPMAFVLLVTGGLITLQGAGEVMLTVATYLPCWMLGYAHHRGTLRATPLWQCLALGVAFVAAGLWWAFTFPDAQAGPNVSDIPMATTLFSVGFVLVLLRLYLDFSWMECVRPLDALVAAMNRRAVTIYLWGNTAIALALWVLGAWAPAARFMDTIGASWTGLVTFAAVWVVLGGFVLLFGWVEDVAARRRPQLIPRRARR